ncbi:MAG TPA: diacylglycerol kinase [Rhodobacteraceae bacterium]|nr:diacylglycerol kinase [Paracoccaceae bacterium]
MLKRELARFRRRVVWSWAGWLECWRNEPSLHQWVWANLVSAGLALWLPMSTGERALILALGGLVLAAELMNTAIERVVDYISEAPHEMARKAKDLASAAVAMTAIAAGVAWAVVLLG